MMKHFALLAVLDVTFAAAAPPVAPPVMPPNAPPVEQRPAAVHPTCAKGNNSGSCICEKSFPLNPNPGPCKCDNCAARCFPLGNGVANGSPPTGYPAAPDGYEWRRDDRGPDGWGLFQVTAAPVVNKAVTTTSPAKAAPVQRYGWRQVCDGTKCVLVYGPLP